VSGSVINTITSGVALVVHYVATMPASHAVLWTTLGYFVIQKAPAKIPTRPQDFWTWGRDAAQGYVSTKTPERPIQPALTVPDNKPTA